MSLKHTMYMYKIGRRSNKDRSIETKCLHLEDTEGYTVNYGAISYPIYQTATYAHEGVGKSTGYDYSRLQNPTREHLEKVVASLENGTDAFAFTSGMAARMHSSFQKCI